MSDLLYACIAKPTTAQIERFLRGLECHGVSVSHFGKNDPPRKFSGSIDEAVRIVFSGTDATDYTFARDSTRKLDFDIQIHHDTRWTYSTVSASCPDMTTLEDFAKIAATAFDLFIIVQGLSGRGKEQPWEVIQVTETCPCELRARFIRA